MHAASWSFAVAVGICFAAGCSRSPDETAAEPPPPAAAHPAAPAHPDGEEAVADWKPEHIADPRLPNAWRLHEQVISGGLPEEPGMQALRELGVKTVISVDGARPDVDLAHKYGLRYVHLPHSYDGIPDNRVKELAKAVRDLPGPVYIHCHHGKHRSPVAAATACVAAGLIPEQDALAVLLAAGTSENYRGLYQTAREVHPLDQALLDELAVDFQEAVAVPPLAEAMVAIEHTHDHLKSMAENGWQPIPESPDLDPAHEVLLLREHFTELLRTDEIRRQPEAFQALARSSEAAAKQLEEALRQWQPSDAATKPPREVAEAFQHVTQDCKTCHQQFRDVPLNEKPAAGL